MTLIWFSFVKNTLICSYLKNLILESAGCFCDDKPELMLKSNSSERTTEFDNVFQYNKGDEICQSSVDEKLLRGDVVLFSRSPNFIVGSWEVGDEVQIILLLLLQDCFIRLFVIHWSFQFSIKWKPSYDWTGNILRTIPNTGTNF